MTTMADLYSCTVPSDCLPPSFRGSSIKYSNVFSLVLQKSASTLSGPPVILQLPFRVLNPTSGLRRNEFQLGCPTFKYTIQTKEISQAHLELQYEPIGKVVRDKEVRRILKAMFEKFGKPGAY